MLPNTYTRLTYLQSSGTQYIDTNYLPTSNVKIETDFIFTSAVAGQRIFGLSGATNRLFICENGTSYIRLGYNTQNVDAISFSTNTEYIATYESGVGITVNDVFTSISTSYVGGVSYSLCVFAQNNKGTIENKSQAKLKYLKIFDNDVIVRDFIPAKRNTDSVLGLYDLVNDVFYTNSGSGTFIGGTEIKTSVNPEGSGSVDISTSADKFVITATPNPTYSFTNWLLKGYTQLEYIESSGTQYIDLNYYPKSNTKIQFKYVYSHSYGDYFLGEKNTDSNDYRFFCTTNYSSTYFDRGNDRIQASYITSANEIHETEIGEFYIKDLTSGSIIASGTPQTYGNRPYPIKLFCSNDYGKIFYLKILEDDTLVRDFIPVIRHSDGAIGLLDKVNLKFYGNSGSGSFIAGGVV